MDERSRSKVVERAAALLRAMGETDHAIGVSELSRKLGLSKTTTHRLLQSFVTTGFVVTDGECYRLGGRILELGLSVLSQLDIRSEAIPFLRQLRDVTGETAVLYIGLGDYFIGVEQSLSRHDRRTVAAIGKSRSFFEIPSSSGVIFLAHKHDDEIHDYFMRHSGDGVKDKEFASPDHMMKEIQSARENGYCIAVYPNYPFNAISFPVENRNGQLVAVIGIIGPAQRWSREAIQVHVPECSRIMADLSSRIRYLEVVPLG
ncbi:MAG: IclR family transcriptional regulator [Dehalococcoidia bacterium]